MEDGMYTPASPVLVKKRQFENIFFPEYIGPYLAM